jgi:hypothetical protein
MEYYRCLFPDSVTILAIDIDHEVLLVYAPPAASKLQDVKRQNDK